jgi:hypothetical protein
VHIVDFEEIGRIPAPGDNVAIASGSLEAGTKFRLRGQVITLQSSLLEGQRFATEVIAAGAALLSWGLPFGWALREILPGEYLCNEGILAALNLRQLDFKLPEHPNFRDHLEEFLLWATWLKARSPGPTSRSWGMPPNASSSGDIELHSLLAGQGVGLIREIRPAAEIVRELVTGTRHILCGRTYPLGTEPAAHAVLTSAAVGEG